MTLKEKLVNVIFDNLWDHKESNIVPEVEEIVDMHTIEFYNWMQNNYCQVGDGFVKDLSIGNSKGVIITTEKALEIYKKEKK